MENQIERIKTKLTELRQCDKDKSLFGASIHEYKLNNVLTVKEIRNFESTHNIILPKGYVLFLINIGNGGAGPFYGLEPLKNTIFNDLDYPDPEDLLNPSKPFLHKEPWNIEFIPTVTEQESQEKFDEEYDKFSNQYFNSNIISGTLNICNFGCAVSLLLIVNGPEYGTIWTDDRASDMGIYPSKQLGNSYKITFLDWYELWLNNSISKIKSLPNNNDNMV